MTYCLSNCLLLNWYRIIKELFFQGKYLNFGQGGNNDFMIATWHSDYRTTDHEEAGQPGQVILVLGVDDVHLILDVTFSL